MGKKVVAQGIHNYTEADRYIVPKEKAVQEKLDWFMGLKLGLMIHWGPGCQLGTFESWPLSDGDGSWSQSEVDWTDIPTFKQQYIHANRTFNPVKFRPDRWAALARECGFKYLLFTTKHHDGFCMFDTKTTDYKVTDPSCPFSSHPYADVTRSLYDAFRKEGLAISTYFSKPDWHCDAYWHRDFGTAPSCNVNYDPQEHPQLWEEFVRYTQAQITELCEGYGPVDVLWLDGGWVSPANRHQDIRLGELVETLRKKNPGLIVCDRTAGGLYENIVTPEKTVPETALPIPWETCTTLGKRFAFLYSDQFKSGHELVHLLLDIVAKGGNLALNIAPQPDGALPAPAVASLKELGRWLTVFGEGIYQTHIHAPYVEGQLCYTKKEDTVYAFYLYEEAPALPEWLKLSAIKEVTGVRSIRTGGQLPFLRAEGCIFVDTCGLDLTDAFYAEGFAIQYQTA